MTAAFQEPEKVGGLFLPKQTRQVQIFFVSGGRVTIECGPKFRVEKNDRGGLVAVEWDSKSDFPFIRLDAIQAIEVVK